MVYIPGVGCARAAPTAERRETSSGHINAFGDGRLGVATRHFYRSETREATWWSTSISRRGRIDRHHARDTLPRWIVEWSHFTRPRVEARPTLGEVQVARSTGPGDHHHHHYRYDPHG